MRIGQIAIDSFDKIPKTAGIKYTLSVGYPNNNYWGSAFGNYYYTPTTYVMGDLNGDSAINILDIVLMVNIILSE